ncbi:MAG: aldo/keto reductase [Candidatus Latescibacteria bacterium]|nr:aldo/keto reductase [Candidatus Latescibacterota bacterium]
MHYLTLPSGAAMPMIGLGTYEQISSSQRHIVDKEILLRALRLGYRHIDSAIFYQNHDQIRLALAESGVARPDVFITTKVYRNKLAYDDVLAECERSLAELGTDYLDLYLVHWPNKDTPMAETFRALGRLVEDGVVRDIGVANFTRANLRRALEASQTPIAVNQVEFHPYLYQKALLQFCRDNNVHLTAYAPIAQTRILDEPVLQRIGAAHDKSPIQVGLRWLVQKGVAAIPKASSQAHQAANLDVFDWNLADGEMAQIDGIEKHMRLFDWEEAAEFSTDLQP